MNKLILLIGLTTVFFIGCSQSGSQSIFKTRSLINRTFEDLTLRMSEDEFKSKLVYKQRIPGKPYLVYSRPYNKLYGKQMKEIENVYEVWCDFFNGKLYFIAVSYCSQRHSSWDVFIHNAKKKYGNGTEYPLSRKIEWSDKKTTLTIIEKFGEQFGEPVSYYEVSYMDVDIGVKYLKMEQQSSPEF